MFSFADYFDSAAQDPERRLNVLFSFLANLYGADKLVLKARKLGVLKLVKSGRVADRLLALQRIVFEDVSLERSPSKDEYNDIFAKVEDEIANVIAQRTVEMNLDAQIAQKMRQRHQQYISELRREALKEAGGCETSTTLERLRELEELDSHGLRESALNLARPESLHEVIGQDKAIESLKAKIGTRYPQHVILYGPPGVGKTTVARLVLRHVQSMGLDSFAENAPFIEVDASTVRWDPREITNPLLGSVHDPIYQGSRRDLAEEGIPEPKLGLVTKAHGGILFLDEIGELDAMLLNKLLKVLEDKRVVFESSYFDEDDPRVPQYIKRLFTIGAPADFILIGATTRQPEDIPLAIRSRCTEVFFDPLSVTSIQEIVKEAAVRLGTAISDEACAEISNYTFEGRKAVQILTDAYGMLLNSGAGELISLEDVQKCIRLSRLSTAVPVKVAEQAEVGHILGLGVSGFLGSCLEIEAAVFPAHEAGKGNWRFNEAAGEMARDSVFNAGSVIRRLLDKDLSDYDVHVNVVGGGRIDGPSAGLAITLALYSALKDKPIRPDLAVTGEVSIRGRVRPVGGVTEKLYGAVQAGVKLVLLPEENRCDIPADLPEWIKVVPVKEVSEALAYLD